MGVERVWHGRNFNDIVSRINFLSGVERMAFKGDLEHLPIVDVIQLLNSTGKSGVLAVKGRKGESQLVFKDGYIVSASHLNNSVRIGAVLVEMGFVSSRQIEQGLQQQQAAGENRRPLAITLIEMDILTEQDAYKALQRLIEMTIVEILTWKSGTFTLDHLKDSIHSDFKYYPEKMNHEVNVNTQSMLMDALRIFDEKMRDGLIEEEQDEPEVASCSDELISVDDLGLADMDHIAAKLPQAFSAVAPFDPAAFQRNRLAELQTDLSEADRERLVTMLARYTKESIPGQNTAGDGPRVVIFSRDTLLLHGLMTVLTSFGALPVAARSEDELETVLTEQAASTISWLIVDAPVKKIKLARNPHLCTFQLLPKGEFRTALNAYRQGVAAVVPRPVKGEESFMEEFMLLLEFMPEFIRDYR